MNAVFGGSFCEPLRERDKEEDGHVPLSSLSLEMVTAEGLLQSTPW